MGLQVWLPLKGSLQNQGLAKITSASGVPSYKTPGKLGNNALNLKTRITFVCPALANLQTFSVAFWGLAGSSNTLTTNWQDLLGFADVSSGGTAGTFRWETTYASSSGIHWHDNATNAFVNGSHNHILVKDTWVHCCVVFDNAAGKIYSYDNGVLTQTHDHLGGKFNSTGTFYLGETNNIEGMIQDVRFYDHALSAKEVEEISKGLILHYKLDNNGFGNENYWGNGKPLRDGSCSGELITMFARTNSAYASVPTFTPNEYIETKFLSTRTPVEDGGIQFQKLQRYSETFNSMCPILEHLKTGEHFTISYELYVTSPVNVRFHLNKVLDGTSIKVQPDINLIQISTLNAWTKVSQSIEIPSSYDESNITTESRLGMYISIREILGTTSSGEVTIRIRNIKFEKSQVATAWTPARADFGHSSDNIIFDSSGYNNNGSITGSLETITSSPRYDCTTHFSATDQKIKISNLSTTGFTNSYSFAWWEKISSVTPMHWGFADGVRLNGMYTGRLWNTGDGSNNPLYNPGTTTQVTTPTANVWHHWVMTGNGTKCLVYQDGELWAEAKTYKPITGTTIYINGWDAGTNYSSNNASMSDFRIYSTALTAEQVKELYNTSTTIDKNGNIYARELVEE